MMAVKIRFGGHMRWTFKIAAMVVALVMVATTFQPAVAKMYEDEDEETRFDLFDEVPGPFRDLKKMVARLQSTTTDKTDSDNDTLYDAVERIIGTDPYNPDTDFDKLSDEEEVAMGTDPLRIDSNDDGVPDSQEVVDGIQDLDGDGVPNAWDDDNDGDGVSDSHDMSVFTRTDYAQHFDLQVNTSGKATSVTFQIRTKNPDNMRLIDKVYDWPYDTEGSMKDLDNSKEDIRPVAMLELNGTGITDPTSVAEYGITMVNGVAYIPLLPKWELGTVVALEGMMYFPASAQPISRNIDASLNWRIYGKTDTRLTALQSLDLTYVGVAENGSISTGSAQVGADETLELIDLGDDIIALRASNGKFLHMDAEGNLTALEDELKWNGRFVKEPRGPAKLWWQLRIGDHGRLNVQEDGSITVGFDNNEWNSLFQITDQGVRSDDIQLAVYPETFVISGCFAEESLGTQVGVFYNTTDFNMSLMANLLLAYQFLRNGTTEVADMPAILEDHDLELDNRIGSFHRFDQALKTLTEVYLKEIKENLSADVSLPVITAMKRRSAFVQMPAMGSTYIIGNALTVDTTATPILEIKSLKTNWYRKDQEQAVNISRILVDMADWGVDEEELPLLMALVVTWNAGESMVTRVDGIHATFEWNDYKGPISTIITWTKGGVSALKGSLFIFIGPRAVYQFVLQAINWFRFISAEPLLVGNGQSLFKVTKMIFESSKLSNTGFWSLLTKIGWVLTVIGLILSVAMAFYAYYAIAIAYDWSLFGIYTAFIYFSLMLINIFGLFVISLIPYVGGLITFIWAIIDIAFWLFAGKFLSTMIMEWIVDLVTDITTRCEVDMRFIETDVIVDDKDGNGLDVGDRITYTRTVDSYVNKTSIFGTSWDVAEGYIRPYVYLKVPSHSGSKTGSSATLVEEESDNATYKRTQYDLTAWVEPGIGMVNYPVMVMFGADYRMYYEECMYLWLSFVMKELSDTIEADPFTIYFDVMPRSIDDFARWTQIHTDDRDADGLNKTEERGRSSDWLWDTDGDGLGDSFELDIGTNPRFWDSDKDGLNDKVEHVRGYDPHDDDTDGDGLSDYMEHSGWVVSFEYEGNTYDWHTFSDPLMTDTDGDGLSDREEYLTLQNPRSVDTDGDGTDDRLRDYTITSLEHESSFTVSGGGWPYILATSGEDYIYIAVGPLDNYPRYIQKVRPDGTMETQWGQDGHIGTLYSIAVDSLGNVYVTERDGGLHKYDADGNHLADLTLTGPHAFIEPYSLDIDDEDNIYVVDANWYGPSPYTVVKVLDRNGTYLYEFGSRGNADDQLDGAPQITCAPDGTLLLTKNDKNMIQVFAKDGTYLRKYDGTGPGGQPFLNPSFVDMDEEGDIYISDGGNERIQKIDKNGRWIATFDSGDLLEGTSLIPGDIVVAPDGHIYCTISYNGTTLKIRQNITLVQVDQKEFTDTDGDGLSDEIEDSEWQINITTSDETLSLFVTSDPNSNDTDGDGLGDLEEYNLSTNPEDTDTDGDGIDDMAEVEAGTDPAHFDSDGDLLGDGVESTFKSDPNKKDTDGEGLSDYDEFIAGSDPRKEDSDDDGLSDYDEFQFKSNISNADSDGDFMFDGQEFELGTEPDNPDSDGDGLRDGYEVVFKTDPKEGDSDGDDLSDGFEVTMRMNPLSNDTDGDGVLDAVELDAGLNPRSRDSDGDGVPDDVDRDHEITLEGTIYLVIDPDAYVGSFIEDLSSHASISIISPEELLKNPASKRYVILIGKPTTEEATAGAISRSLLEDTPAILESMMTEGGTHLAVRYSKWTSTQTIVMLSRAYSSDTYRVLGILKSLNMKVTDGAITADYISPASTFLLDDSNTLMTTGATLLGKLDEFMSFKVDMVGYGADDGPHQLTQDNGLEPGETSTGRYVEVEVIRTDGGGDRSVISGALLTMYYTLEDLDQTGDGDADDPEDIDETTLALYVYNNKEDGWVKLTDDLEWVEGTGLETWDFELFGVSFAGRIWANVTHLSLFGAGGMRNTQQLTLADAGEDLMVTVDEEVTFDGSASEGIGGITRYTWTFVHNWQRVTLYGEIPTFTFKAVGEYQVTLEVRDSYGGKGATTFMVTVSPLHIPVRIGPIVDSDSTTVANLSAPIQGAVVRITWGDLVLTQTTDFSGYAYFMMDLGAMGDDLTITVRKEGYEPQEYVTSITADGQLEQQPSSMVASETTEPPDKEAEGPKAWEYGIIVVMLVLVLLALLVSFGKRPSITGKKDNKAREEKAR